MNGPTVRASGNDSSFSSNLRTNGYQYFNPACFSTPATGYFGNSGRGVIYNPGVDNWDVSVVKSFSIYERLRFELRGEAFNFFNHVNFTGLDNNTGDIASNKFGKVSGSLSPRLIQISGKISGSALPAARAYPSQSAESRALYRGMQRRSRPILTDIYS